MNREISANIYPAYLAIMLSSVVFGSKLTADELDRFLAEAWDFTMRKSPMWASHIGDHRFDDQLPIMTLEAIERNQKQRKNFFSRLKAIGKGPLGRDAKINLAIFRRQLQDEIAEYNFASHLIPITNRSGFHISFPELPKRMSLKSTKNYRDYVVRLEGFAEYAQQHVALMRAGVASGHTLPAPVLEGYRPSIEIHIVQNPTESLLYAPFKQFPEGVPESDRPSLVSAARKAIVSSVVPGYRTFLSFMEQEYVPAARGSIGASALPDGRAFYRHRVKRFTTLDLTPDQVHELGHSEVHRIRKEMQAITKELGFAGNLSEFIKFVKSDSQFYATTSKELMMEVALVLKTMDGKLPELFGRLPQTPYGIREVPAYIAPRTTTAYYMPPAGDGSRSGFYYVNTFNLNSRPLYGIEALSLHEAVPGHHLQIALQQELKNLPSFRRFGGITAFVEGWALYAERLGLEVGFYEDPYRNFGRLTYEMWRACRLVVDTGIHYFGWTRSQAVEFMQNNTGLSDHNIRAEVDRYISWPGQALAYKMGELKIRDLRARAEQQLGAAFDVREFHDVVLGSGAVPLDILEENVSAYIGNTLKSHEQKKAS